MRPILIGCDPELFVKNGAGKYISAHDLLPGTKEKPYPVEHGAVQVDGVAAEFNIDPAKTVTSWLRNISSVMNTMEGMLPTDHKLARVPAVVFDPEYFATLPEDVRALGCNMDYNAWTGQPNPAPDGASTTMRTAAGHIHIGFTENADPRSPAHIQDCCEVAKQIDYYTGVPSLVWDNDPRRRLLYGKAGCFRPKTYGLEYRSLSNRWLAQKQIAEWVYNSVYMAIHGMFKNSPRMTKKFGNMAQMIIDGNQYDVATSADFRKDVWSSVNTPWPTWSKEAV